MKAIAVAEAADLAAIASYMAVADRLLFDARPPKDATRPGGHGRAFDWTLLSRIERKKPIMLSGGLTPENVADAIRVVRPDAVDVSSGVESAPGVKDASKIKAFVAAARKAANALDAMRERRREREAQFASHRPRRARAFRHLWRPLRRRDADAARARTRARLHRGQERSRLRGGAGLFPEALCRPAEPALFRRAADRTSAAARRSI